MDNHSYRVVKSQEGHGSDTWNFCITFLRFLNGASKKRKKSRFWDFQKKRKKTFLNYAGQF